jgi:hypothetical protein
MREKNLLVINCTEENVTLFGHNLLSTSISGSRKENVSLLMDHTSIRGNKTRELQF